MQLALLVSYLDEPDVFDLPIIVEQSDSGVEIRPENVPVGDTVEDRRTRNHLIRQFYFHRMGKHEDRKVWFYSWMLFYQMLF